MEVVVLLLRACWGEDWNWIKLNLLFNEIADDDILFSSVL